MQDTTFLTFCDMLEKSRSVVFFGGAGVSTESGIPDFRSADGIYQKKKKLSPETILSHSFFMSHPAEFYEFYRANMVYPDAKPNAAHHALAELERAGKLTAVITQNIDGLHQAAGSTVVHELHGSVHRNTCMRCGRHYGLDLVLSSTGIPLCPECGGTVKPDVVLYEEPLDSAVCEAAIEAVSSADMMIVGGTSLTVYPAAGFVRFYSGSRLVIINASPTPYDSMAGLVVNKPIGEFLSQLKQN